MDSRLSIVLEQRKTNASCVVIKQGAFNSHCRTLLKNQLNLYWTVTLQETAVYKGNGRIDEDHRRVCKHNACEVNVHFFLLRG